MKRNYTPPALYAEQFSLMEHIASCVAGASRSNATDAGSCFYNEGSIKLFLDESAGCDEDAVLMIGNAGDPSGMSPASILEMMGMNCINSFLDASVTLFRS